MDRKIYEILDLFPKELTELITSYLTYDVKTSSKEFRVVGFQRDGPCKIFFPNGKVKYECFYQHNRLHGEYRRYYKNGNLKINCHYENGKLEGEYHHYFPSGGKEIVCYYRSGKLEGKYEQFYLSYRDKLYRVHDKQVKIGKILNYKDGKLNGEQLYYHRTDVCGDPALKEKIQYVNHKRHGEYQSFYWYGGRENTGTYQNGLLHGPFKYVGAHRGDCWISVYENGIKIKPSIQV